jgi:hypothetical protein
MLETLMPFVQGHCLHQQDFHSAPSAAVVGVIDEADNCVALRYDQRKGRYASHFLRSIILIDARTIL